MKQPVKIEVSAIIKGLAKWKEKVKEGNLLNIVAGIIKFCDVPYYLKKVCDVLTYLSRLSPCFIFLAGWDFCHS